MTTYEVIAWFVVEAENPDEAMQKVKDGVIGGRASLGEIQDWDVDDDQVEEREPLS